MLPRFLLAAVAALPLTFAATAEQWRDRSVYQIITDRFALPSGSSIPPEACDPLQQKHCGGTWNAIRENLDYVQSMGFTAIWISPVHHNIAGPTAYGEPYHGYWIDDHTQLNPKFGTPDDLKALSAELHKRGMFLMVDIVVNNVVATTTTPDFASSNFVFKNPSQYHPYCKIKWGDATSEQQCWMGDEKVALVDINTEDQSVVDWFYSWIGPFVQEYGIDGLRIDAAKHVRTDFWPGFCGASGVFCIGEVFGDDIKVAASYQGPLDSVLNFPAYSALQRAFSIPGDKNMTGLVATFDQSKKAFKDLGLLGNFLENHDLPRWSNMSVDPQSMWNAMAYNWMTDGIPIMYYGQEQGFSGIHDPSNREALWQSKYAKTDTVAFTTKLNQLRNWLIRDSPGQGWLKSPAEILSFTQTDVVIAKGYVVSILTNVGSPPANVTAAVLNSGYPTGTKLLEVISCEQRVVGASGSVFVDYSKGGRASIFVPADYMLKSGICEKAGGKGLDLDTKRNAGKADSSASRQSVGDNRLGTALGMFGLLMTSLVLLL